MKRITNDAEIIEILEGCVKFNEDKAKFKYDNPKEKRENITYILKVFNYEDIDEKVYTRKELNEKTDWEINDLVRQANELCEECEELENTR